MQNRMSFPIESRYFGNERTLRLDAQKAAIIDWAEVDDHHAILDAGCSDGSLLAYYARHFMIRACGMVTDHALEDSIREKLGSQAEILRADRMDIPWRDNSFHEVFVAFPLRNHPETGLFLMEVLRVLKEKGQLLISVPCTPILAQLGIKRRRSRENYVLTDPYQLMHILESCGFSEISMRISRLKYATVTARKSAFDSDSLPMTSMVCSI